MGFKLVVHCKLMKQLEAKKLNGPLTTEHELVAILYL